MTIYEQTKTSIRKVIDTALLKALKLGELSFSALPDYGLEEPREKEHGDFATNAAMLLAKEAKKPPRAIAEIILSHMNTEGTYIKSAEVAGAGFLNFRLDPAYIREILSVVEAEGDRFGRVNVGEGKKIMVEFVSANPTGPMHMGNARGGALGDCLAAVLDWAGYDVTREFYINDAGNQIEKFGKSLEARYIQALKGEDAAEFPEDGYHGEDIKERAAAFIEKNGDGLLAADSETRKKALVEFALELNINDLKKDLEKYRIFYDIWFRESILHENGAARQTVDELIQRGHAYEKDGAVWFRATDFGEAKDEVLVRQNGFLTYYAVDIAYHKNKFIDRGFDTVINIWGADHHGHVARLKGAMKALGIDPERLEVILMQLVRLVSGGEVVRMSKRTGKSITLKDLLEETSIDAARFFFNMRQANSHFDFDLDLAVEQSNENPVFYVQYAHARICSILRLLSEQGVTVLPVAELALELLSTPQEIELMKKLADFPETIRQAAQLREPSLITRYAMDLAAAFHTFYAACKVNSEDKELTAARLKLCDATRVTLKNAMQVMSISAPEQM
ncbi:MAG: arginine--tRNA ligase [Ruminococcaceae bacterium]|nr:arginine--tRNA ligase [Oscillospiraceae bacterium]